MTIDLISNMLISLQNALSLGHSIVEFMYSSQCLDFTKILYKNGFLKSYAVFLNKLNDQKIIRVELRYTGYWILKPFFSKIIRISKQGKRIYIKKVKLEGIKNLTGLFILSSSSGMITHLEAYRLKKGGEVICYIC